MRRDVVQAPAMDLRGRGQAGESGYRQGGRRTIKEANTYDEGEYSDWTLANIFVSKNHAIKCETRFEWQEIKEDLETHNRPVSSCLDQIRQVVLTGSNVLSSEEVSTLEKNGRSLKTRFDKALDRADKLVKRLTGARDELTKFK